MNAQHNREAARVAFYSMLARRIAREWTIPVTVEVRLHPPQPDHFAVAAVRTFACPKWQAQNAALDAMLAEFPGSDGRLTPLPEVFDLTSKVTETRVRPEGVTTGCPPSPSA